MDKLKRQTQIAIDMAIKFLQQTEHNTCPREALWYRGIKTAGCEDVCDCDLQKGARGKLQCRVDRAKLGATVMAAKAECWRTYLRSKAEQKQQQEEEV